MMLRTVTRRDIDSLSDAELARSVLGASDDARDAEAELCRRFAPRIRMYGLRHLSHAAEADDLVQRVCSLMVVKLRNGEVREPDRIASFVLGMARMQARTSRRRGRLETSSEPRDIDLVAAEGIEAPRPLDSASLARCLQTLGERERSVVLLSFYDERDASEVATALAITPGNVRVIRHRAIGRLRRCMNLEEVQS